jgi:hypothetical protein
MTKPFRGRKLNISVENPNGKQSGVKSVTVNGGAVETRGLCGGLLIDESILKDTNDIVVVL